VSADNTSPNNRSSPKLERLPTPKTHFNIELFNRIGPQQPFTILGS
jgi:hypothetical protein